MHGSLLLLDTRADSYVPPAARMALLLFYVLWGYLAEKRPALFIKLVYPVSAVLVLFLFSIIMVARSAVPALGVIIGIATSIIHFAIFGSIPFVILSFRSNPRWFYLFTCINNVCVSVSMVLAGLGAAAQISTILVVLISVLCVCILLLLLRGVETSVGPAASSAPYEAELMLAPDARNSRLRATGLTRREAEVAELLYQGKTRADIASTLCVAPITVDNHITKIYAKLGVKSLGAFFVKINQMI
jgi:DNA-binding CsgD family transcriptional regulator